MGERGAIAVELRSVTKRFGEVVAVDRVGLQIRDGEFFSLLGPSGCGKTTSLRLIAGFEMPDEGEVWIGGAQQGNTPAFKRPVNTVFQNYALFPHMNVYENVAFGLEMHRVPAGEIRRRVTEALEMVRLPGLERRRPRQLSGGQQQRVALARALINRPKVLLLDEPLGALDLKLRKAMQLELKALQEQVGITFTYVTHDQEEALTMSDRIAVMDRGRVLQVGTPEEIYERPADRFVADFIGETNLLPGKVVATEPGAVEVELAGGARVRAASTAPLASGNQVTIAVRPERILLGPAPEGTGWNRLTATVEDVVYTGATTSFLLRTPAGTQLSVRRPNEDSVADRAYARGDQVEVRWRSETGSVFAGGTGAEADA
jgi:spermidine/putrescine transport system ATP-binding protein